MIKTRFAPSPTGFLHIGVLRTALFSFLMAKKNNGKFVLRLEDTDKERSDKIFEEDIIETLKSLNTNWNEGPYRQSERGEIYKKYLNRLIEEDNAYHCFCSKEELDNKKEILIKEKKLVKYDGKCSKLTKKEVEERLKRGDSSVIRLRVKNEEIEINDLVKGKISFDTSLIDDFVIAKNLDTPLYNFTVVVDDFEMGITDVVRGEDILSNTPKQIILYRYLNAKIPQFAHLPMILGEDRSKLSKRHGAVAVSDYLKEGYLKEAIINFIAFLGWSPGDEREIFSLEELIKEFSIEKVNKSNAIFNLEKLNYLNGFYIRKKPLEEITTLCIPYFIEKGFIYPLIENKEINSNFTGIIGREIEASFVVKETGEKVKFEYLKKVVSLYKERMKKLSEITDFSDYCFTDDLIYDKELLFWKDIKKEELIFVFNKLIEIINKIENWDIKNIEEGIMPFAESYKEKNRGAVLWPLRASLTGKKSSAGPFEVLEVLGKEKAIKRIKKSIEIVQKI